MAAKKRGFFEYVKTAFLNHWNLLFFGAGTIAAAVSGHADIALPLLAAGEIAYLTGMSTNRKFQKYVDAEDYREARQEASETQTQPALKKIYQALDPITRMQMQDLLVSLWREVEATIFFVTHSIEEAVYLGDRVYLFSNSPGTILEEVEVPPPDRPAMDMQREPAFQEVVYELRDTIDRLEREQDLPQAKR